MPDKLKPCPFCGGEARIGYNYYENYSHEENATVEKCSFYAECTSCGITTDFVIIEEAARDLWDRRTNDAAEFADRMRQEIRDVQEKAGNAHIFFDAKAVLDMIDEAAALTGGTEVDDGQSEETQA